MRSSKAVSRGLPNLSPLPAAVANVLVIAPLVAAVIVLSADQSLYYRLVQEDGGLEWMTFWSFGGAAGLFGFGATQARKRGGSAWFHWAMALACFLIAMEEISWGQRIFGYRPPAYFLQENFQQELNVHNVFGSAVRKLALKAVILVYGVVLPLGALTSSTKRLLLRFGVVPAPLALVPAFTATFLTYQIYPWRFSGEIVELMLGLGFLCSVLSSREMVSTLGESTLWWKIVGAAAAIALVGSASAGLSRLGRGDDPATITAAQTELQALATDFADSGQPLSSCGIHKRVYSFAEKYGRDGLLTGRFADLVESGLPEERARYFIDPWNSPIWVRHHCDPSQGRQRAFVYSFGPNRHRESSQWEIRGDDLGTVFLAIRGQ